MALHFEWDPLKALSSELKHGLSFEEGATVFEDALSVTVTDSDHSQGEQRFATLGLSRVHMLLVVVHADRGSRNGIISVRGATRRERKDYENGQAQASG